MKAVIDASAVLAALEDDRPADAVSLHDLGQECRLLAPALISSEMGNVIHRKGRVRFGADARDRHQLLEAALEVVETMASTPQHRELAGALAERHGLSFYDAEYLALALEEEAGLLVTEDLELSTAARQSLGKERVLDWEAYRRRARKPFPSGAA